MDERECGERVAGEGKEAGTGRSGAGRRTRGNADQKELAGAGAVQKHAAGRGVGGGLERVEEKGREGAVEFTGMSSAEGTGSRSS